MCCAQTQTPNSQEVIHPEQLREDERRGELRKEGQAAARGGGVPGRSPVSLTLSVGAWFPVGGRRSVGAVLCMFPKRDLGTGMRHRPGWAVREQPMGTQALSWTLVCLGDGVCAL